MFDYGKPLKFLILLLATVCTAVNAADDVRVVIDVSGSMVKTDPNNLRRPALRMINGLIPSGTKAGVWTFGRYVNMEVKWGTVNDSWRKQADAGAAVIHSRGQFTNIESALNRASKGWQAPDPKTNRNLILLTDGQVDISKNAEKNQLSRQKILDQVLPKLVNNGVKIHAIALSDQSDESLLRRLARQTGGSFEVANSAEDLQRIFLRMFERATKPDTVPFDGNQFTIDKSIKEMTLLVFRKGKQPTRLLQPDKTIHTEKKNGQQVSWRHDQGYDLITVKSPQAGVWSLDVEMDPDNRVMIVTDLKLQVSDLPAYQLPVDPIELSVELHNEGKKIAKQSFLKFVDFTMVHKVGEDQRELPLNLKSSRDLNDKGIYLQQLTPPLIEGDHEIMINADSRTFSRTRRINVRVEWPVKVMIKHSDEPGIYDLEIAARDEYVKPDTLELIARIQLPDNNQRLLKLQQQGEKFYSRIQANDMDGLYQLLIHAKALTVDGREINHDMDNYSVLGIKKEPEPKNESPAKAEQESIPPAADIETIDKEEGINDTLQTIIWIVVGNLVLFGLGGVLFWLYRRKAALNHVDLFEKPEADSKKEEAVDV